MGYLVAMCGIFVISRLGEYKKFNVVLVALFCVCFSLAIEVLWEIFEWAADSLFGQTMQGEKLPGVNQPLVGDTMLDLVCNTTGAVVFFFHFVLGKTIKRSLGINFIEKQLIKEDALIVEEKLSVEEKTTQTTEEIAAESDATEEKKNTEKVKNQSGKQKKKKRDTKSDIE